MPRRSYRSRALANLLQRYERAKLSFAVDQLLDDSDIDSIDIDLESPTFLCYARAKYDLDSAHGTRNFRKRGARKSGVNIFDHDLHKEPDGTHWMNDDEFKHKYRMSRDIYILSNTQLYC